MDPKELEKYSSAYTLSDMEVFVFPELMYSLVLANIMSPVIWRWRELDCFRKLEGKGAYRKLLRLRQYIMDEYDFNLDLETWGLTDKQTELRRFSPFIAPEQIAASNALFGYEGDRYYFDVDIRRHFGLDRYTEDVIPYWKTETVEAMDAFRFKPNYTRGAGECVSLSALYAAAAFIVCGVPLDDIFMILTPLHSQDFIDIGDGIITNNRRLVTKAMWFNGTEISNKAQRALRNEQVTIVAHRTGYVHCLYRQATMDPKAYQRLRTRLRSYLQADLNMLTFASFLRTYKDFQQYFQVCRDCHGSPQFVKAEVLYAYEHGSKYRVGDETFEKLLAEVNDEDFVWSPIPGRLRCDQICGLIEERRLSLDRPSDREMLRQALAPVIPDPDQFIRDLEGFLRIEPRLPSADKDFVPTDPVDLAVQMDRQEVIAALAEQRRTNKVADLAFYAFRDMTACDWRPFVKAALERSPVSLARAQGKDLHQVYDWLGQMPNESIYEGPRLAQPDEVVNYQRGDGLEKAFVLASIIYRQYPSTPIRIEAGSTQVVLEAGGTYTFASDKGLRQVIEIGQPGQIRCHGP
ncbi:MAG: hypothetical protein QHH07_10475 [Sedimentisphaerales bacterium]|jgi:hypothetical protein|nr:hypothetical protein [Sedimentisphaerales bacterium]